MHAYQYFQLIKLYGKRNALSAPSQLLCSTFSSSSQQTVDSPDNFVIINYSNQPGTKERFVNQVLYDIVQVVSDKTKTALK